MRNDEIKESFLLTPQFNSCVRNSAANRSPVSTYDALGRLHRRIGKGYKRLAHLRRGRHFIPHILHHHSKLFHLLGRFAQLGWLRALGGREPHYLSGVNGYASHLIDRPPPTLPDGASCPP